MSSSLQPHGLQHFPVLHYLLEFAQTHVHLVSDAIQPSHHLLPLLLLPSVLIFPASRSLPMRWLFTSVAKVLALQHQSFQWIFRVDFLWDWLVWSCSPRNTQEPSSALQFESLSSLALSLLYGSSSQESVFQELAWWPEEGYVVLASLDVESLKLVV